MPSCYAGRPTATRRRGGGTRKPRTSVRTVPSAGAGALTSVKDGVAKGFLYSAPFFVAMTPSGWSSSRATAINNREMVAGHGDSPEGRRSFLRSGATYDFLTFPGWTATEAATLNGLGRAAGSGWTASRERHA